MEGRPGRGVSSARCAGGGAGDQATAAQLRGELRPCCPESCPLLLESPPAPRCCLVGPCRPDPARHPAPAGPRPPPPSTRPPQYGQALLAAGAGLRDQCMQPPGHHCITPGPAGTQATLQHTLLTYIPHSPRPPPAPGRRPPKHLITSNTCSATTTCPERPTCSVPSPSFQI